MFRKPSMKANIDTTKVFNKQYRRSVETGEYLIIVFDSLHRLQYFKYTEPVCSIARLLVKETSPKFCEVINLHRLLFGQNWHI